jgi:DNA polymerase IV
VSPRAALDGNEVALTPAPRHVSHFLNSVARPEFHIERGLASRPALPAAKLPFERNEARVARSPLLEHRIRDDGLSPARVTARADQVEGAQILEAEGIARRHGADLSIAAAYRIEQIMNTSTADQAVQWLFLDLNAFFASCEQQDNPALRGQPIIVVQTVTSSACAIAASYEAKRLGITTGTLLHEAKQICPAVIPVQARHPEYHERMLAAVDTCVPIEKVMSIDEVACRLMGDQRQVPVARALALKLKQALREQVGECLTCSIGIAPNVFLGKVGSDLQKPDGLVVITKDNLPEVLLRLELQDIYGIGKRMEERLNRAGIHTVAELWNATPFQLRRVWGGINGLLFHQMLHGVDIQPPSPRFSKSIGHQHVLEPELRTAKGAHDFAQHLLTKAAERLRRGDYYCRRLGAHLSWTGDLGGWWDETDFQETRDTGFLLARLDELWKRVPRYKPLSVGVVLLDLVPADYHQPDLFKTADRRRQKLSPLIDRINGRYAAARSASACRCPRCARSAAMPRSGGCRKGGSFEAGQAMLTPRKISLC